MNLTLSVEDEIVREARVKAERLGTSVNALIRDYLKQLAGVADHAADAAEFERLSRLPHDDAGDWKFSRAELYERRR